MKARFIRGDIEFGKRVVSPEDTHLVEQYRNQSIVQVPCWKVGAIYDDPKAFRYVQMGICESADDECAKRANMTPKRMAAAIHAYERLSHGIHHDDFKKYDDGEILGYNADGSDIPGPNAVTFDDVDEDEDEDEDEE